MTDAAARSNGGGSNLGPDTYQLTITDPSVAVTSLLGWSQGRGIEMRGLEVVPGTLEDVFLQLTGRELRE